MSVLETINAVLFSMELDSALSNTTKDEVRQRLSEVAQQGNLETRVGLLGKTGLGKTTFIDLLLLQSINPVTYGLTIESFNHLASDNVKDVPITPETWTQCSSLASTDRDAVINPLMTLWTSRDFTNTLLERRPFLLSSIVREECTTTSLRHDFYFAETIAVIVHFHTIEEISEMMLSHAAEIRNNWDKYICEQFPNSFLARNQRLLALLILQRADLVQCASGNVLGKSWAARIGTALDQSQELKPQIYRHAGNSLRVRGAGEDLHTDTTLIREVLRRCAGIPDQTWSRFVTPLTFHGELDAAFPLSPDAHGEVFNEVFLNLLKFIEVFTPSAILQSGIVFVDMPGLNDTDFLRAETCAEAASTCDVLACFMDNMLQKDDLTLQGILDSPFFRRILIQFLESSPELSSEAEVLLLLRNAEKAPSRTQAVQNFANTGPLMDSSMFSSIPFLMERARAKFHNELMRQTRHPFDAFAGLIGELKLYTVTHCILQFQDPLSSKIDQTNISILLEQLFQINRQAKKDLADSLLSALHKLVVVLRNAPLPPPQQSPEGAVLANIFDQYVVTKRNKFGLTKAGHDLLLGSLSEKISVQKPRYPSQAEEQLNMWWKTTDNDRVEKTSFLWQQNQTEILLTNRYSRLVLNPTVMYASRMSVLFEVLFIPQFNPESFINSVLSRGTRTLKTHLVEKMRLWVQEVFKPLLDSVPKAHRTRVEAIVDNFLADKTIASNLLPDMHWKISGRSVLHAAKRAALSKFLKQIRSDLSSKSDDADTLAIAIRARIPLLHEKLLPEEVLNLLHQKLDSQFQFYKANIISSTRGWGEQYLSIALQTIATKLRQVSTSDNSDILQPATLTMQLVMEFCTTLPLSQLSPQTSSTSLLHAETDRLTKPLFPGSSFVADYFHACDRFFSDRKPEMLCVRAHSSSYPSNFDPSLLSAERIVEMCAKSFDHTPDTVQWLWYLLLRGLLQTKRSPLPDSLIGCLQHPFASELVKLAVTPYSGEEILGALSLSFSQELSLGFDFKQVRLPLVGFIFNCDLQSPRRLSYTPLSLSGICYYLELEHTLPALPTDTQLYTGQSEAVSNAMSSLNPIEMIEPLFIQDSELFRQIKIAETPLHALMQWLRSLEPFEGNFSDVAELCGLSFDNIDLSSSLLALNPLGLVWERVCSKLQLVYAGLPLSMNSPLMSGEHELVIEHDSRTTRKYPYLRENELPTVSAGAMRLFHGCHLTLAYHMLRSGVGFARHMFNPFLSLGQGLYLSNNWKYAQQQSSLSAQLAEKSPPVVLVFHVDSHIVELIQKRFVVLDDLSSAQEFCVRNCQEEVFLKLDASVQFVIEL